MPPNPTAVIIVLIKKPTQGINANSERNIPAITAPITATASSLQFNLSQCANHSPMIKLRDAQPQIMHMMRIINIINPIGLKQIEITKTNAMMGMKNMDKIPAPQDTAMFFRIASITKKVGFLNRATISRVTIISANARLD